MKKISGLVVWIIGFEAIGYGMGLLTKSQIPVWYHSLERSSLTPPDYIFGLVWSILYAFLAISGWLLWQQKQTLYTDKSLYIAQMVLNFLWTPLFFYFHQVLLAFSLILLMILLSIILLVRCFEKLFLLSTIFIFYTGWLSFAAWLNFYIWFYNAGVS